MSVNMYAMMLIDDIPSIKVTVKHNNSEKFAETRKRISVYLLATIESPRSV